MPRLCEGSIRGRTGRCPPGAAYAGPKAQGPGGDGAAPHALPAAPWAARTTGVRRLIYVSYRGVAQDAPVDIFRVKWYIEDAALEKNNEQQYYTPEEVFLRDGVLVLRSRKRLMGGRPYTSGLVETKGTFAQAYGRFEVRAKLPRGQGIWPAHWLLPADGAWPRGARASPRTFTSSALMAMAA